MRLSKQLAILIATTSVYAQSPDKNSPILIDPPTQPTRKVTREAQKDTIIHSPASEYEAAATDLTTAVQPNRRPLCRYFTTYYASEEERLAIEDALRFWMPSLTLASRSDPLLVAVASQRLYRFNLDDFGWSAEVWEKLVERDPYFRTTTDVETANADGTIKKEQRRGWISPKVASLIGGITNSKSFILRADTFLVYTGHDRGTKVIDNKEGLYSDFMKFPAKEEEFYKLFQIDLNFIQSNNLNRGGAVIKSIVALSNRELELLPTLTGNINKFLWRTHDVADSSGNKCVLNKLRGTIDHDGRELIGSNLHGLHYYKLFDKNGDEVGDVPIFIAQDRVNGVNDTRVINPYKCVGCHGPSRGIQPFTDVIGKMILSPEAGLAILNKSPQSTTRIALESYYLPGLEPIIKMQQDEYEETIKRFTDLTTQQNSANFVKQIETYKFKHINYAQACREMGIPLDLGKKLFRISNEASLLYLSIDDKNEIKRDEFERAFANGMRTRIYEWEQNAEKEIRKQQEAQKQEIEANKTKKKPYIIPGAVALQKQPGEKVSYKLRVVHDKPFKIETVDRPDSMSVDIFDEEKPDQEFYIKGDLPPGDEFSVTLNLSTGEQAIVKFIRVKSK